MAATATACGSAAPSPSAPASAGPVVVTPDDARYEDVVRAVNGRYSATPEAVYLADSSRQVVDVVQRAVDERKRLTVRSGGHCQEDFVFNPEVQVVLDLSGMKKIYFDPRRRAVVVEPGAVLSDVYETTYKTWGVALPAGIYHSVGIGGLVAGGGHGHLSRTHGVTVDHLEAVEVVVVDAAGRARTVVASRDDTGPLQDLWWAHTGGGGGNFGVVTRYWFRSPDAVGDDAAGALPRPPAEVLLGVVPLSWGDMTPPRFAALLKNYGAFFEKHKDPASPFLALNGGLALTHRSSGKLGVTAQVDATRPDAGQMLDGYLTEVLAGVTSTPPRPPRRVTWLQSVRLSGTPSGAPNDPTLRGDYKSALMRANFPDEQVDAFYRQLTRPDIDNPMLGVSFTGFGGRINAVDPHRTAFAHRDCSLDVLYSASWSDPADDAKNIGWNRDLYGAVYAATGGVPVPDEVTDGCYVNDVDTDVADPRLNRSAVPWHQLYYKDNYPRLQRAKASWDPLNFFRHALSVQLP